MVPIALISASAVLATTPSPAVLQLSPSAFKADGITLRAVAPARRLQRVVQLPVTNAAVGTGATVELGGTLRFSARRNAVDVKALSLSVSASSVTISGRTGTSRLKLFTLALKRPATLRDGGISLAGARVALTKAAATKLKAKLRLRRTPSTKALGTFGVNWAPHHDETPAPAPIVTTPAATPTPTPTPAAGCPDFAATPANSVDWFACDLPGALDLHSWTDYVQRPFAPVPCQGPQGTVTASGGAARIDSAYDHRFPIASVDEAGATTTIQLNGQITYAMPVHGIDEAIGSLKIVLTGDHGEVYADGRFKDTDMSAAACTTPPTGYTGKHVLDLDLTGIQPVTAGGVKRWVHVPAKVVAGTGVIGGGQYDGRAWGAFTIAVAAR
jgi:hypothetical protein